MSDAWPILSATERRVLGVLVEKAKTTPDAYPLSLNSLVTGCNQKSNREPIMNLDDVEIEDALSALQKKGLAGKITGSRVERWRHGLYEAWHVGKVELAILAELLLRGPQTQGELRGRASRMEPIDDLDQLRAALQPMVERGLILYLTPEGRRGTIISHGFHAPDELERLRADAGSGADAVDEKPIVSAQPAWSTDEVIALRAAIEELRLRVDSLTTDVQQIKQGLGL
jgi:uncharacterized protein YceH (UPF0502 family)